MNDISQNSPLKTIIVWAVITILSIIGIFLPFMIGMEGFNGGFAIAFICFFLAIIGVIVMAVYAKRAITVGRILKGKDLLAHWTYTPEEWREYTEKEYKTEGQVKKVMFFMVAGIALLCGIIFFAADPKNGKWVLLSMIGLIAVIAFVAWFTTWYNRRQNRRSLGETFITLKAVYINRQLHTWGELLSTLKSIRVAANPGQSLLIITYAVPTRTGMQEYTVRIPVPKAKEREAEEVAQKIREYNTAN
jgi:uncharacterized RDD family membrane protein YckC